MIFVSYAWINDNPDERVLQLVTELRNKGFDVCCDVMFIGDRTSIHFKQMMAQKMQEAEKVIVVLSETYKKRADLFQGGVGDEYRYILGDIDICIKKYILISFSDRMCIEEVPAGLTGREIIYINNAFKKLLYRLEDLPEYQFPKINPIKTNIVSGTVLRDNISSNLCLKQKDNLPFVRNPFFTARKDIIDLLHTNFNCGESRQIIQILSGFGGVGKTQVALEYAYIHMNYYQLIWWIDAETKQGINESFYKLSAVLGNQEENKFISEEERGSYVIDCLSILGNYLLIFDNANSYMEIEKYIPKCNSGAVLITSRDNNWKMFGHVISIDIFMPDEAITFLKNRTMLDDLSGTDILSKELGYLPLALEQAAAYIINNSIDFFEYVRMFEQYKLEMFKVESSKPLNYASTVVITLRMSLDQISNLSSIQLLEILSFLSPDAVDLELFVNSKNYLPNPLSICISNSLKLNEVIWQLKRYSLIKVENDIVSMHRLLQEIIRDNSNRKNSFEYAYKIIINSINNIALIEKRYPYGSFYSMIYSHILAICKNMQADDKIENEIWYEELSSWYISLFSAASITSSWITTFVKNMFEIIPLLCYDISDLDFFINPFIWLINENQYQSNYINSVIGNYFIPLLEYLDKCPDSIDCAFYIVLSVVGGRNGWKNQDIKRDLLYLQRAKKNLFFI